MISTFCLLLGIFAPNTFGITNVAKYLDDLRADVRSALNEPAFQLTQHRLMSQLPETEECIQAAYTAQVLTRPAIEDFVTNNPACQPCRNALELRGEPEVTKTQIIADEIEFYLAAKKNWKIIESKRDDVACAARVAEGMKFANDWDRDSNDEAAYFRERYEICRMAERSESKFNILKAVDEAKMMQQEGSLKQLIVQLQKLSNSVNGRLDRAFGLEMKSDLFESDQRARDFWTS